MTSSDHMDFPGSVEGWVARLGAADAGPGDAEAFDAWCAQEPGRRAAYRELRRLHDTVRQLRGDDLVRAASRRALAQTTRRRRMRRWVFGGAAVAASLLVVVPVGRYYLDAPTVAGYATQDRVATMRLPDGTRVVLDAQSRVSIRFDRGVRRVELANGRAQFQVASADVPFEVRAGDVVVHDIGTTFQVARQADGTHVALLDGQVSVRGRDETVVKTLARGEAIRIGVDGDMGPVDRLEPAQTEGWTHGHLVFRGERLADLLATMNRYAPVKIALADERLGELRISGNFHAGDQDALVAALAAGWRLRAERRADGSVLLREGAAATTKGSLR